MYHTYVADWLGMPQVRMGGARMTHSPLLPRARVTPLSAYALCRHALVRDHTTQGHLLLPLLHFTIITFIHTY